LQESVGITKAVDDPTRARRGGWCFDKTGSQADAVYGEPDLLGIYNRLTKGGKYVGRVTLPLLVDTKTNTIVCNESKDIVRQLRAMSTTRDLAPPNKVAEIEAVSSDIYRVNNGVYKCGFSSKQGAYDYAVTDVFNCLDDINAILEKQRFLTGNTLSEADVFLLPTITRFDAIYHPFFRASKTSISLSYPAIMRWLSDMCAIPNVRDQFDLHDAKRSYYKQLFPLNPSALIPATMEQPYLEILANTKEDPAYASTVFDNK
jgi:glutathionyl-hydroquinone reductase